MRARSWRWLALTLPLLMSVAACSRNGAEGNDASAKGQGKTGRAAVAVPVSVTEVVPHDLARTVAVTGPVEPIRTVTVNAQTAGTVLSVLVEEGNRVHGGQLMAQLDARETTAQLERARAVLANAQAAYERMQRLQKSDLSSDAEMESARSTFDIAKADVQLWSTRLAFCRVTAPISGIVTAKRVEKGAAVSATSPMFSIADDSLLVVRVRVSELDVAHLRPDQPASIQLDAYPGVKFSGYIRRIFPSADAASRLVPVETVLGKLPQGVIARPGYLARVEFALNTRSGVLAVPAPAIGVTDSSSFVYVVKADTLSRRTVKTGLTTSGWIEITSGLEPGERVVSSGHVNLRSGVRVRVSGETPPPKSAR